MTKKENPTNNQTKETIYISIIAFFATAFIASLFVNTGNFFAKGNTQSGGYWERIAVNADPKQLDTLDLSGAEVYQVPGKLPYIVMDENTWIPVSGEPVEMITLNDSQCGQACDTAAGLAALRGNISPTIVENSIDINTSEGKELVEKLNINAVPQFIFNETLESVKAADGTKFVDNLPVGILNQVDEQYVLSSSSIGLKVGKYISQPEFADLDSEPSQGTGPVQVIEFTNYQCGYCKKLHDNISASLKKLIAENKVTYIVKDFPMFGANDQYAHRAANCVLREGGQDAYWNMNKVIFDNQGTWSQHQDPETYFNNLASNQGVDIAACVSDPTIEAEINADMNEGRTYGVSGTPALFIGTQIMPGAIDAGTFENAVLAELEK